MRKRLPWVAAVLLVLAIAAGWGFRWLTADLPDVDSLPQHLPTPSVRITDRHGRLLYELIPESGGRHTPLPLDDIPLPLRQATIATEDSSFYENPGVDLSGVLRALWINLRGGQAGGSTITQQLARNLLLPPEERSARTLRRKLREAILAWQLTRRYSKDEILALYLNQIYYGAFAYGVEAAAQTFFGKSARELDLAESALLAGLPQAPGYYNPLVNPEAAKKRQRTVLALMEKHGDITPEESALAQREPLVFTSSPYPIEAPHFVMMVRAQLDELLPAGERARLPSLTIRTTLDLDWQHLAERAIAHHLQTLRETSPGRLDRNVNNAALVALDPKSGEILALVGSPDFFDTENGGAVNMALAPRQPGSALKPLIYAAALDPSRPQPWTPATTLLDVRTTFYDKKGQPYTPVNYDGREHGPVPLRQALASSLNIPAVRTLEHLGLQTLSELASRLGITTLQNPEEYDLSLALGGGEVRLIDLTAAYGAFANGGKRVTPTAILEIRCAPCDAPLYQAAPPPQKPVLDARLAWLISDILSDNDARLLGFGPNSALRLDRPAAVKTGTTTNFHDNWTVGYTPQLVAGVWVGNTSNEPMRNVDGLSGAAPIWHQFMRSVLEGQPEVAFQRPEGLVQVEVCTLSGLLPTEACPYTRLEWFIEGTQPTQPDDIYYRLTLDTATGTLADVTTPPERRRTVTALDLPPEAHNWARSQGLPLLSDLLVTGTQAQIPSHPTQETPAAPLQLHLLSPANNASYQIAADLPLEAQRLQLEAIGPTGLQQVELWMDGDLIATFHTPPYRAWWQLEVGAHQVWAEALTSAGQRLSSEHVQFEVTSGN